MWHVVSDEGANEVVHYRLVGIFISLVIDAYLNDIVVSICILVGTPSIVPGSNEVAESVSDTTFDSDLWSDCRMVTDVTLP